MRALYYAQKNGAKIVNMSFDFSSSSTELANAINYVSSKGVVLVAAAGNNGSTALVYPAAYSNVMGVASTSNLDQRSTFSNYGSNLVWMAAPGEGVVTTYPYGTYAASWGTSFSAPMASGAAAILLQESSTVNETNASSSLAHADYISTDLNHGRLNIYTAVYAWRTALGIK
jgi:thermitase